MPLNNGKWWWAYLDDQGVVRIKKFKNDKEIWNCERMFFCKGIFDPFQAESYEDAKRKIASFLDDEQFFDKRSKGS